MNNKKHNSIAREIHDLIANSNLNDRFKFRWVKGHSNKTGNDTADKLARKATTLNLKTAFNRIPDSFLKNFVQGVIHLDWQENGARNQLVDDFIPLIKNFLNNKQFKISFQITQLLTGHSNINSYLHRFGFKQTNNCPCDQDTLQTIEHLLFFCPFYDTERAHLERMVLQEGGNWPCKRNMLIDNKNIYLQLISFIFSANLLLDN